jgi:hypothetical protein
MRAAILAGLLCVVPVLALRPAQDTAQAQESIWRPVARQCAAEIDAQAGCGSCGGLWPQWAECTIKRVYGRQVSEWVTKACINQIQARRNQQHACAACGDPVADVVRCVGQ